MHKSLIEIKPTFKSCLPNANYGTGNGNSMTQVNGNKHFRSAILFAMKQRVFATNSNHGAFQIPKTFPHKGHVTKTFHQANIFYKVLHMKQQQKCFSI